MPHADVMQGDIEKRPTTFSRLQTIGIVVIVVMAIVVVALMANSDRNNTSSGSNSPAALIPAAAPLVVHYEVEGDGASSASLTVQTPTGTSQQTADLPVTKQERKRRLDLLWLLARRFSGDTVVSENTSSGAYQIATCQAQA